eukprot:1158931-Pelagomonas_calceolata.AAC.3
MYKKGELANPPLLPCMHSREQIVRATAPAPASSLAGMMQYMGLNSLPKKSNLASMRQCAVWWPGSYRIDEALTAHAPYASRRLPRQLLSNGILNLS